MLGGSRSFGDLLFLHRVYRGIWPATLPAGKPELTGGSWSPFDRIKHVEVSFDGGSQWKKAKLEKTNTAADVINARARRQPWQQNGWSLRKAAAPGSSHSTKLV
jgi:hypothetical protein